jgi:hypothetical protein
LRRRLFATGAASASYANTGLSNGTKYYYKVTAVNCGGASIPVEFSATP